MHICLNFKNVIKKIIEATGVFLLKIDCSSQTKVKIKNRHWFILSNPFLRFSILLSTSTKTILISSAILSAIGSKVTL